MFYVTKNIKRRSDTVNSKSFDLDGFALNLMFKCKHENNWGIVTVCKRLLLK